MTIVRSEHRVQFTIIPNAILRDELGLWVLPKGAIGTLSTSPAWRNGAGAVPSGKGWRIAPKSRRLAPLPQEKSLPK